MKANIMALQIFMEMTDVTNKILVLAKNIIFQCERSADSTKLGKQTTNLPTAVNKGRGEKLRGVNSAHSVSRLEVGDGGLIGVGGKWSRLIRCQDAKICVVVFSIILFKAPSLYKINKASI